MKNARFRSSFNLALPVTPTASCPSEGKTDAIISPLTSQFGKVFRTRDLKPETCIFWVEVFCGGLNTVQQ
jgi:hypothetical protein